MNSIVARPNNNKNKSGSTGLLWIGVVFLCLFLLLAMVTFAERNDTYKSLFVLPVWFALMSFLSPTVYANITKSQVALFLSGGYFIRMVLSPFLFALGGYDSFFPIFIPAENVIKAVVLMCLECSAAFLMSSYCLRRMPAEATKPLEMKQYKTSMITFVIVCLLLFMVFAFLYVPAISEVYLFLPTVDLSTISELTWDNETIVARGSLQRYVYSLFAFLWPIIRGILPAFCISQLYKRFGQRRLGYILSTLCLFIPALLLSGDNIAPFLGVIFGALTFHRIFGRRSRKYLVCVGALFVIALIVIVTSKLDSYTEWRGASGISVVAQFMNAYFPGVDNIAAGFSIINLDKWSSAFYDLYYTIPFKETLFGLEGENLSNLYNQTVNIGGQIVPWCTQLAHYFGFILSSLITAYFVQLAYKTEQKSRQTTDFWKYYVTMYLSISIAMSISVYSVSIFLRNFVNVILPLIIIIKIGSRKRENTTGGAT